MVAQSGSVTRNNWNPSFGGRRRGRNSRAIKLGKLDKYKVSDLISNFRLEIGFGYGENILHNALLNPDINYVGCEVYFNGISNLLQQIDNQSIQNISIWPGDARVLLEKLPKNIIEKTYILFPDPWPKRKHHKRRLISNEFLLLLANKMKLQGEIIIATDNSDYATWIERTMTCTNLSYCKNMASAISLTTRYQAKSTTEIHWFQCSI